MSVKLILCLTVLSSFSLFAEKPPALNVKAGLWEVTVTNSSNGLPPMPQDMLAKLPPEQRARIEELMKQRGMSTNGNSTVVKSCVTREKIDKGLAFAAENTRDNNCTHTVVSSSPSHLEVKYHCDLTRDGKKTTLEGTTSVDVSNDDSARGSSHIVTTGEGGSTTVDTSFSSRYLGPACGDIK